MVHVASIVVGSNVVIGSNCDIRQNITIGGNFNFNRMSADGRSQPVLGDNTSIGVGAAVLRPVTIGTNSIIDTNSVVTRDIPPDCIAAGLPACVLKKIGS